MNNNYNIAWNRKHLSIYYYNKVNDMVTTELFRHIFNNPWLLSTRLRDQINNHGQRQLMGRFQ